MRRKLGWDIRHESSLQDNFLAPVLPRLSIEALTDSENTREDEEVMYFALTAPSVNSTYMATYRHVCAIDSFAPSALFSRNLFSPTGIRPLT